MAELDLGMNLYDFNKQAISQLPVLDMIKYNEKASKVAKDMCKSGREYWMLMCREQNDYTVFVLKNYNSLTMTKELQEVLNVRGFVVDIDETNIPNQYEIWVRDPATNENFVYYLFDYCEGVVEVR